MSNTPRINSAGAVGWPTLGIGWRDGTAGDVSLAGWIATGGDLLSPLKDPTLFAQVGIGGGGAFLFWLDPDGDLAIDALHVANLIEEQRLFSRQDLVAWQESLKLSNQEAADLLSIGLSTWNGYKAGHAKVPRMVSMICKAALRDPLMIQAYYRPRIAGRPKEELKAYLRR